MLLSIRSESNITVKRPVICDSTVSDNAEVLQDSYVLRVLCNPTRMFSNIINQYIIPCKNLM